MIICTLQIEAENQFVINQTMRDYIYRLKKVDYATSIKDLAVWSKDRGVSNGNKAAPVNGQIPSFNL